MNPYDYPRGELRFNLHLRQTTRRWLHYAVDFPIAQPTGYTEYNAAHGEYFRPRKNHKGPLVILAHGWGDSSVIPCKLLARALVKRGIACFILYQAFHSSRMPETIKTKLPDLTSDEWVEIYRISVTDVRQVVDWASNRAEINAEQIGAIGISFGGFISAITMGIDKRIRTGVFLVAGGNSEKIARKSRASALGKRYKRSEAEYNQIQNSYAQYLAEVAENGFEDVIPVRKSFLTDPITFAHYLKQRPVLMINALWDEFIPKEATLDLWQASGKPAITWYPATHATIWLWYLLIKLRIAGFLRSAFRM